MRCFLAVGLIAWFVFHGLAEYNVPGRQR